MRIIKLKNGAIATVENMSFKTNNDIETQAEVEFDERDLKDIRDNPFDYQFEFDEKGKLSKIKKGAKTINPKKLQNI